MSKRILIIPSWYPTLEKPLNGSFFQEQAQFLNGKSGIEIQVLYGEKKSRSLFIWIGIFLESRFKSSWKIFKDKLVQNPVAYGFSIPANRRVPDFLQISLELMLFEKAYRSFYKKGWQPDLIHAQGGMDAGIYAHRICKKNTISFVLIEHQVVMFHHYSRLRARLVLDAYKAALKLGAVSNAQIRLMVLHEPECSPIMIPDLVDEHQFSLRENSLHEVFQIATIMYPNAIKGFRTFFDTMRILKERKVNFRFTVVGKGGELFKEIVQQMGLDSHGELIEIVKRQDIPRFMVNADLYVCSSDFETFGIAPREAMMCGVPVVSTANGGVEDSIKPETGLVVPVRDAKAMARAILKVKENKSNYNPKVIRELAIRQCGGEVFLRAMLPFYQI